ncbi:MAG: glycoside hydrolase family 31 protein [Verrucomicrobiota bacterium]
MRYNQISHPSHFESPKSIERKEKGILLLGNSFKTFVECESISSRCTKLSFIRKEIKRPGNCSDGILSGFRKGKKIAVRKREDGFYFKTPAVEIDFRLSKMQISFPEFQIETVPQGIGFNGDQTLIRFKAREIKGFYGFGERTKRFNKSGDSLCFWTVDVVSTFPHTYHRNDYDPSYVSIPLAILRCNGNYVGFYFDNPHRLTLDVKKTFSDEMMFQSLEGDTDLYLIAGPTLRDVVRHFSDLTGRGEIPPLWSMGYHQCRFGYQSEEEFQELEKYFSRHDIPVSAVWYDIHYMDAYRVFTWNPQNFPAPKKLNDTLKKSHIRSVAIIDPGVKEEIGYRIYDAGKKKDLFCKATSGLDYVGRVWPGDTVFPDYTLPETQKWWAKEIANFMKNYAVDGIWIDMNDPSTGWSRVEDMKFQKGTVDHSSYHNQYAHFMAKATREGFQVLDPTQRPFILTRSAFTGTQRYSAVWTGDNHSNWEHLRMSIPCSLNLSLSGVAFNGPDVGGFMGDSHAELMIRWHQVCFLFPFFRNHSNQYTKNQEPWEFSEECLLLIRDTILMRYRLLPYLYQCFFEHYLTGDPILRPLLYEFDDAAYENVDDQFLVGNGIMVAPILHALGESPEVFVHGIRHQTRSVFLPKGWWFDLIRSEWVEGGKMIQAQAHLGQTPLFVRDGSIIPYFPGKLKNSKMDLSKIEMHFFIKNEEAVLNYYIDNPENRDYLQGKFATMKLETKRNDQGIEIHLSSDGSSSDLKWQPVFYGENPSHVWRVDSTSKKLLKGKFETRRWMSEEISVLSFTK